MAEKMSAGEALSMKRSKKESRKKIILIAIAAILVVVIVIAVISSIQAVNDNKTEKAKALVAQLDINSTYKEAEFLDNDDWDSDGIKNVNEGKGGTNLQNEDTDGDGISDGDEISLGTDPLNPDSDKDGMLDGYEIMAGTDPKQAKSDGTTDDSKRVVTINRTFGTVTAQITGCPNVADLTIEELNLTSISSNTGLISKAYDIYTDFAFEKLSLTFNVDEEKLKKLGAGIEDITVLKFNSSDRSYEKISSKTDASNKTVSADISELGTYIIGVEKIANEEPSTKVAFLIDNSGSMYADFTGYDVDYKRLDFASELIDRLNGDYSFLISKFTGTYTKLQDFTNEKSKLTSALESIRKNSEDFNGTHSQTALEMCIQEFTAGGSKKQRNVIVFLTDGESDEVNGKSLGELVALAKEKSITIMTVGLGRDIDRSWLQQLAAETEGKYYSAADAAALTDVYKQIETTFDFDMISYNSNDDTIEGYSLYNTGFKPDTNGFSFKNFRTTSSSGVDFGMAVFARDWYLGNIKTKVGSTSPSEESKLKYNAAGYDLTGTKLEDQYNKRESLINIIPSAFAGEFSDPKSYLDFSSGGTVLEIKDSIREKAELAGWAPQKYSMKSGSVEWNEVELLCLDIANSFDKIKSTYSDWEAELYAALHTLNSLQWNDKQYEFNLTNGDEGFEKLKSLLAQGVPVVTTIDDTHTVNAIGLIQDSKVHRQYILQVYDSNYPGKTKEIYITRSPIASCNISNGKAEVKSTTFEYSTTYEGKQVGLSFSDVQY